jgi:hypothetical protein
MDGHYGKVVLYYDGVYQGVLNTLGEQHPKYHL